jgi:hypothetical protein
LEFDNTVERYVVQPVTIQYYINNKRSKYTPDIAVYYVTALNRLPLLVEIKYAEELQKKKVELERKFTAARQYGKENGFEFKVFTEKEIRTPYLDNVKFLGRYLLQKIEVPLAQSIVSRFDHQDKFRVQELIENDKDKMRPQLLYTTWQLLAQNILSCNLHEKLSMATVLWKHQNQ